MNERKRYIISWLTLAAVFAAILVPINVPKFGQLAVRGQKTSAAIVSTDCQNHASARYTFNVGAASYSAVGLMSVECRTLKAGDVISIYYDVTDPTISSAVPPVAGTVNEFATIALVCLLFPPLIIATLKRGLRRFPGFAVPKPKRSKQD